MNKTPNSNFKYNNPTKNYLKEIPLKEENIQESLVSVIKELGTLNTDKHLVVLGCGDLWRLILPDIKLLCDTTDFSKRVKITFVETYLTDVVKQRLENLKAVGANISTCILKSGLESFIQTNRENITAAFITTPPDTHIDLAFELLELLPENAVISMEKPLGLPNHISKVSNYLKSTPDESRLLNIDFFSSCKPMLKLFNTEFGKEICHSFGIPSVINVFQNESMEVDPRRLGGDYGLLKAEIAGGGLFCSDMGPHTVDMLFNILHPLVGEITNVKLLDLKCYTYLPELLERDDFDFRETYGIGTLEVSHSFGSTLVTLSAGKGLNNNCFGAELFSTTGEQIIISPGCCNKPFLLYNSQDKRKSFTEVYVGDGIGYDTNLIRILSYGEMRDAKIFPKAKEGLEAAIKAVEIPDNLYKKFYSVGRVRKDFGIYKLGENPEKFIRQSFDYREL